MPETALSQEVVNPADRMTVMEVFPGMIPELFETVASGKDAVVLVTNVGGGIQNELQKPIADYIVGGGAVFVLPDDLSDKHGVTKINGEPTTQLLSAGVSFPQSVNVNSLNEFSLELQAALASGLRGRELALHIEELYRHEGQTRPTIIDETLESRQAAWREQQGRVSALGLGGVGFAPLTPEGAVNLFGNEYVKANASKLNIEPSVSDK